MEENSWYRSVGTPGLMRAARGSYAAVVREDLAAAGFDDMPRNGVFALTLLLREGGMSQLTDGLGVRKKAEGELIDQMVMRGYVERTVTGQEGEHVLLAPTERGMAAERIAGQASSRVDAMLEDQLGADGFEAFREGLLALAKLRSEGWTDSD
jgi:DNA-binding MarR family transcriptional regulator